jgi:hypothetical protein
MALKVPADEKGSLIAFFYRIRFDTEFQAAFKATGRDSNGKYLPQDKLPDPNPVVALFELTAQQNRLINELHDLDMQPALRDQKWDELMEGATADVYKWTYQEKSVW